MKVQIDTTVILELLEAQKALSSKVNNFTQTILERMAEASKACDTPPDVD